MPEHVLNGVNNSSDLILDIEQSTLFIGKHCPGCSTDTKVNQDIVDFAVRELKGSDEKCSRTVVKVDNFKSQVFFYLCYNQTGPRIR